ncbi:MAG: M1 family metallopeptidase, partial [Wenzhouxiangellaceae bacterium]
AALLAGCQTEDVAVQASADPVATIPPMPTGQLGQAVIPRHYTLDLTILPERDDFSGRVAIDVEIGEPSPVIWLHGRRLAVEEAWLEQGGTRIEADYAQADETGVARVELVALPEAGPATLNFVYQAPFDRSLEGLYKVVESDQAYAFTQFQATSARLAFPGFDEPAFKTPFEIHVTAEAGHEVITTTAEIGRTSVVGGLIRRSFEITPPLPTYLIAFAVGPLDVVEWDPVPANEVRDWPLPLRGVAARGKGGEIDYALANTARLVEVLERYFDYPMPYPKLDIIAVPDFAAGAMENVGAITYREQLLLLDENDSIGRKRAYASVHAHELAHMWFGNLVTPKWWDDIWLNESFATWMAAKAAEQAFPDFGFEDQGLGRSLGVMNADSLATARQVRQPIESNHDIANAFDGITYSKGGAMLSMFEAWLGEEAFREGVRLHMRRFEHSVADYRDFLESLAEGSGRPEVVEAFSSFLFQPGVPLLETTLACQDGQASVAISQSRYLPLGSQASREQHWTLPLCLRFGAEDGQGRQCRLIDSQTAVIELDADFCPAWVMPNAGGNGYYRFALDGESWQALSENFAALEEAEARVMLDSMSAAFRSGDIAPEALLEAGRVLAANPARQVATAPIGDLALMHDRLARTEAAREGIAEYLRELYVERLESLGLAARDNDSADDSLLRSSLAGLLSGIGGHRPLIEQLDELADVYLEDLEISASTLDPGLVGTAVRVAVERRDHDFAVALFERMLESTDATFRGRILGALGASEDPETGAMLRAHIADERLRDNEAFGIAFGQVGNEAQREALWQWSYEDGNLEALLARIPTWRKGAIVNLGAGFCSNARANELEQRFGQQVQQLEGGPRALAQTLERIRLCAALQ